MPSGVGTLAQAVHAEHGVELLQEDQPRVEAPGEQAAVAPLVKVSFYFLQFISPSPLCRSVEQMEQKMTASDIFKDKKDNYPQSVPKLFVGTRLSKSRDALLCSTVATQKDLTSLSRLCLSDGEDINPKVLQTLGSEKMKVSSKQREGGAPSCLRVAR